MIEYYHRNTHSTLADASAINPIIHRRAKWRNALNTWLIVGGMAVLLGVCGWALFGRNGAIVAVTVAVFLSILSPRVSPAMVLRLFNARPIVPEQAPQLFRILVVLAKRADLPSTPRLYYVASSNMNAFAVGSPTESAITVTDGLLRALNLRQLTGVLAHEISHISNEDLRVMGLADMVGRLTNAMQSIGLVLMLFGFWQGGSMVVAAIVLMMAPAIGTYLQLALSRSREYDADLGAAHLTGDPIGLASALHTLHTRQGGVWESIFLPGGRTPDPSILRTHPKPEDRIARLMELQAQPTDDLPIDETPVALPTVLMPVLKPPRYHFSGFWY
ncbi:MAG: zinc metalloprotease HtpX [Hyphomicrobiaceae bacterium]